MASLVTQIMTMIMQGLKNFSKAARDLLMGIHKIDNANYPEVTSLFLCCNNIFIAFGSDCFTKPMCKGDLQLTNSHKLVVK